MDRENCYTIGVRQTMRDDFVYVIKIIAALIVVLGLPIFLIISGLPTYEVNQANLTGAALRWASDVHVHVIGVSCHSDTRGNYCSISHGTPDAPIVTGLRCTQSRVNNNDLGCYIEE